MVEGITYEITKEPIMKQFYIEFANVLLEGKDYSELTKLVKEYETENLKIIALIKEALEYVADNIVADITNKLGKVDALRDTEYQKDPYQDMKVSEEVWNSQRETYRAHKEIYQKHFKDRANRLNRIYPKLIRMWKSQYPKIKKIQELYQQNKEDLHKFRFGRYYLLRQNINWMLKDIEGIPYLMKLPKAVFISDILNIDFFKGTSKSDYNKTIEYTLGDRGWRHAVMNY